MTAGAAAGIRSRRTADVPALVAKATQGEARAVGRLISLVEDASPALREVMALLAPQASTPTPAAPATTAVRAALPTIAPTAGTSHRGTVTLPSSDRAELRVASASAGAQPHSTTARTTSPRAPQLALVQRPRPPTVAPPGRGVRAATGRSPPPAAGT